MSQIAKMVQLEPVSPFDLFGVSTIKIAEEIQSSCSRAYEGHCGW